jgi:hypothetical protein
MCHYFIATIALFMKSPTEAEFQYQPREGGMWEDLDEDG